MTIEIKSIDGKKILIDEPKTAKDIIQQLYGKVKAVAVKINGKLGDLFSVIDYPCTVEAVLQGSDESYEILRHTASHILAQAVKRLYPDAKLGIGPAIKDGFYYDIDIPATISEEDLEKIEKEMKKIVKENIPIRREELSREDAIKLFKDLKEDYKVELLSEMEDETVSIYRQKEFVDLCRGPHLPYTSMVKHFKLTSVAGAYWRGDEKNKMLTRIYGTAFFSKEELSDYLYKIEEAKRRDHRKLGKELEIFMTHQAGPGFPFILPNGMVILNELINFWRKEHIKRGYKEIRTPLILDKELWVRSGHWDHYRENMYFTVIDERDFAVKPMNCPGGILVYKSKKRSYRELPLRLAELGVVHRHERSGVLHGLMRVRAFTQDDAHIYMMPDQVEEEILGVIDLVDYFYSKVFGFKYHVELSTKPEKAMGSDEIWELATNALKGALKRAGIDYEIKEGEGAFYGPKIDFHLEDCLGRSWQCGTVQLDFLMPQKFELTYVGPDGSYHTPVMIHRVVFGSLERFLGILIEHYAGAFPFWLAPIQVVIIPVSETHIEYAKGVENKLSQWGLRVEVDVRNETISKRIRDAQLKKIPYMLVVGDKEVSSDSVAVRKRGEGDIGSFTIAEFKELINKEFKPY